MTTLHELDDPFSFGIQLNTDEQDHEFHRKNDGDEIQRPDVVDDSCLGLNLLARIDRIVHGTETEDGRPATLIVFGFRFHGISEMRRFKQATITITFRDEQERSHAADPEVIAQWPNGDVTLGEPTTVAVDQTKRGEVGGNIQGGQGITASAHVTQTWECKETFSKTDRSRLTGSIILNRANRKGKSNATLLTLSEDKAGQTGIITDFKAVVMLRRTNDIDRFVATVKVKAKAHFLYNTIMGLRDISGLDENDPVVFVPGEQYLRPPSGAEENRLATELDSNNLAAVRLRNLGGVLGTVVLPVTM